MASTDVAETDRKVATAAAFLEVAGGRPCDGCHTAPAVLHCRADAAFICGACDARVHGANGLASRHERSWLCEVCEHSPAVVTCTADAAVLCATCDADIHSVNPLAYRHERVPLLPFSGPSPKPRHANFSTPVASACHEQEDPEEAESAVKTEVHSWLLPGEDPLKSRAPTTTNFFFSGCNNELLDLDLAFVPQMEDIKKVAADSFFDLDLSGCKADADHSYCHSMSSSEAAVVPDISRKMTTRRLAAAAAVAAPATATRMDRKAKVMKYLEKRKNRKFEKTIRYASRKAYAEARPRIKGRFAKRTEAEAEAEAGQMYSSAVAAFLEDDDLCVPSFYS